VNEEYSDIQQYFQTRNWRIKQSTVQWHWFNSTQVHSQSDCNNIRDRFSFTCMHSHALTHPLWRQRDVAECNVYLYLFRARRCDHSPYCILHHHHNNNHEDLTSSTISYPFAFLTLQRITVCMYVCMSCHIKLEITHKVIGITYDHNPNYMRIVEWGNSKQVSLEALQLLLLLLLPTASITNRMRAYVHKSY